MRLRFVCVILAALCHGSVGAAAQTRTALFAGGDFHQLQQPFDQLPGVTATLVGYAGGGAEAVQVSYDSTRLSYETLLTTFWRNVDPFAASGQFCDHGEAFQATIFAADESEKSLAEASLAMHRHRFGKALAVVIASQTTFRPAEAWHQQYYLKNPSKYRFYRLACGRDARLREIWGGDAPQ